MVSHLLLNYLLILLAYRTNVCLGLIGGAAAPNYPFFVSIEQNGKYCGGTFVAANAIVTAARCLFDAETWQFVKPNRITIIKRTDEDFEMLYACEKYFYHTGFEYPASTNNYMTSDIAILKLKECASRYDILPPCSANIDYFEAHAIGFNRGQLDVNGRFLERLEEVKLYHHQCARFVRQPGADIHEVTNVCFGSNATLAGRAKSIGITSADYGGPLFYKNRRSSTAVCLYGIASAEVPMNEGFPITSVFTRAGTFNLFIQKALESFTATSSLSSCGMMK